MYLVSSDQLFCYVTDTSRSLNASILNCGLLKGEREREREKEDEKKAPAKPLENMWLVSY